jgi:hypothetical protein
MSLNSGRTFNTAGTFRTPRMHRNYCEVRRSVEQNVVCKTAPAKAPPQHLLIAELCLVARDPTRLILLN